MIARFSFVLESEREWARLDVYLLCNLEDGLKSDTFFADVSLDKLRAVCCAAHSLDVLLQKAVFVAIDDDFGRVNSEANSAERFGGISTSVLIVLSVLN